MDRRHALKGLGLGAGAATVGLHGLANEADAEAVRGRVNTHSEPSDLKITDLRVVGVHRRWFVRVDTNQDLYGYGEVRDGGSPTSALMLKSRIVGESPLNVDKIFRKLKQFGTTPASREGRSPSRRPAGTSPARPGAFPAGRCSAASSGTRSGSTPTPPRTWIR